MIARIFPIKLQIVSAVLLVLFVSLAASPLQAQAKQTRIIAFGDSLTAGYGLSAADAFPARLEQALRQRGHDIVIVNAGVSGDTASAGLARLDWTLAEGGDAVILELGANDALRGIDPAQTRAALDAIMTELRRRNLPVLIAGMAAPRNLGDAYVADFDSIYPELAQKYEALLYPFFLDGVATDPALNQGDGLHPTPQGVDIIVARILPKVEALIERVEK